MVSLGAAVPANAGVVIDPAGTNVDSNRPRHQEPQDNAAIDGVRATQVYQLVVAGVIAVTGTVGSETNGTSLKL